MDANDLNRQVAKLELALPLHREASRIYKSINPCMDSAEKTAQVVTQIEEDIRNVRIRIATRTTATTASSTATRG